MQKAIVSPCIFSSGLADFTRLWSSWRGGRECVLAAEIDSFIRESIGR